MPKSFSWIAYVTRYKDLNGKSHECHITKFVKMHDATCNLSVFFHLLSTCICVFVLRFILSELMFKGHQLSFFLYTRTALHYYERVRGEAFSNKLGEGELRKVKSAARYHPNSEGYWFLFKFDPLPPKKLGGSSPRCGGWSPEPPSPAQLNTRLHPWIVSKRGICI